MVMFFGVNQLLRPKNKLSKDSCGRPDSQGRDYRADVLSVEKAVEGAGIGKCKNLNSSGENMGLKPQ